MITASASRNILKLHFLFRIFTVDIYWQRRPPFLSDIERFSPRFFTLISSLHQHAAVTRFSPLQLLSGI